jgi:K+-transporting ATPase ATPase B chain
MASVRKLDPRVQLRNPVMFVVEVGALLTTFAVVYQIITGDPFGGGSETCSSPSR